MIKLGRFVDVDLDKIELVFQTMKQLKQKNEIIARINLLRSEITELKSPIFNLGNKIQAALRRSEISQLEIQLCYF